MNWNSINTIGDIVKIKELSTTKPVLIFKHSTRCSISSMSLNRLERGWNDKSEEKLTPYLLDLIAHRDLSQQIAEEFHIHHESPQVILIKNGEAILDASHMNINLKNILSKA